MFQTDNTLKIKLLRTYMHYIVTYDIQYIIIYLYVYKTVSSKTVLKLRYLNETV